MPIPDTCVPGKSSDLVPEFFCTARWLRRFLRKDNRSNQGVNSQRTTAARVPEYASPPQSLRQNVRLPQDKSYTTGEPVRTLVSSLWQFGILVPSRRGPSPNET